MSARSPVGKRESLRGDEEAVNAKKQSADTEFFQSDRFAGLDAAAGYGKRQFVAIG